MELIDAKFEFPEMCHYVGFSQIGSHMGDLNTPSQLVTVGINNYHIPQT